MFLITFPGELKHALDLSKPKLVFVSLYAAKRAIATCRNLPYVQNVVVIGGRSDGGFVVSLSDFVAKYEKIEFNVDEHASKPVDAKDQVAVIFCSSGTTGMPKGVLITHNNIISVVQAYRHRFVLFKMMFVDRTLAVLNVAPWFHVLGFMSMVMLATSRTANFVFLPRFEEEPFLRSIEKYKISILTLVPPVMVFLAKTPLFDKYDLSSLIGELGSQCQH